jgi:hypothetical protein
MPLLRRRVADTSALFQRAVVRVRIVPFNVSSPTHRRVAQLSWVTRPTVTQLIVQRFGLIFSCRREPNLAYRARLAVGMLLGREGELRIAPL